jgi:hypothetical protein
MTTTMELKRSNLVLPTSGYELDEDEMSYVEGGGSWAFRIRISAETVGSLIGAGIGTFIATCAVSAAAKSAKYACMAGPWGVAIVAVAAVVGGILGGIIGNALEDAYKAHKGIDVSVSLVNSWLISGNNTLFTLDF